jgi:hypothetical protein
VDLQSQLEITKGGVEVFTPPLPPLGCLAAKGDRAGREGVYSCRYCYGSRNKPKQQSQ